MSVPESFGRVISAWLSRSVTRPSARIPSPASSLQYYWRLACRSAVSDSRVTNNHRSVDMQLSAGRLERCEYGNQQWYFYRALHFIILFGHAEIESFASGVEKTWHRRRIANAAAVTGKVLRDAVPTAERRGKAGKTMEAIWLDFCMQMLLLLLYTIQSICYRYSKSTKQKAHITFNLNILKYISKTLEKCGKVNVSSCRPVDQNVSPISWFVAQMTAHQSRYWYFSFTQLWFFSYKCYG